MGESKLFISIVVPAHNEEDYIYNCLDSIISLDYPPGRFEVIVVNNNSTDRTCEIILQHFPIIRLVDEPRQGVVFAGIRGIAESKGEIVAFTDADCIVPRDWLINLVDVYNDPSVVAVGGATRYQETSLLTKYQTLVIWVNSRIYRFMMEYNMSFRTTTYYSCGAFDERIGFGEDALITQQLKKVGRVVILNSNAVTTSLRRQHSTDWLSYTIKAILFNFSLLILRHPLHLRLKPMSSIKLKEPNLSANLFKESSSHHHSGYY